MRRLLLLAVLAALCVPAGAHGSQAVRPLAHREAHAKAERVLDQLRFVVDDVPAAVTVEPRCTRVRRAWRCGYVFTFADGARWSSVMVLRRWRGYIGWLLTEDLPIRWPTG